MKQCRDLNDRIKAYVIVIRRKVSLFFLCLTFTSNSQTQEEAAKNSMNAVWEKILTADVGEKTFYITRQFVRFHVSCLLRMIICSGNDPMSVFG